MNAAIGDNAGARVKCTAADIKAALMERFPTSSHALLFEVGNSTGARTNRHADAVAMGLWPSRGMEVEGVEVKVSRGDWKRELADHSKSDAIQRYCDRWWIAAPKGLIPPAELPASWGLLEFDGKTLRQKVQAPKLEAQALSRGFIAAMLRRAAQADAEVVDALVSKKLEPIIERERERAQAKISERTAEAEAGLQKVKEIEALTGIRLSGWTPAEEVAAAIKFALKTGLCGSYGPARHVAEAAERLLESLKELMPEEAAPNG